ncbi:MAG: hypothetical protein M0R03_15600 [Novosphingobium sp.]|nr:hypothetical protein [Novosphingobium sp.]
MNPIHEQIIKFFQNNPSLPHTIEDISTSLGMDVATINQALGELLQLGYVYHTGAQNAKLKRTQYWYPTKYAIRYGTYPITKDWTPAEDYKKHALGLKDLTPESREQRYEDLKGLVEEYFPYFAENHPEYTKLLTWLNRQLAQKKEFIKDTIAIFLRMQMSHKLIAYHEKENYKVPPDLVSLEHAMLESVKRFVANVEERRKDVLTQEEYLNAYSKAAKLAENITNQFITKVINKTPKGSVIQPSVIEKFVEEGLKDIPKNFHDLFIHMVSSKLSVDLIDPLKYQVFFTNTQISKIVSVLSATLKKDTKIFNQFMATTQHEQGVAVGKELFTQQDYSNYNLAGINFNSSIVLKNCNFTGANFKGSNWGSPQVVGNNFTNAKITNANFAPSVFRSNIIEKTDFADAIIGKNIPWEENKGTPDNLYVTDIDEARNKLHEINKSRTAQSSSFPLQKEELQDAKLVAMVLKKFLENKNNNIFSHFELRLSKFGALSKKEVDQLLNWLNGKQSLPAIMYEGDLRDWLIQKSRTGELEKAGFSKKRISELFSKLQEVEKQKQQVLSPQDKKKQDFNNKVNNFISKYQDQKYVPSEALTSLIEYKDGNLYSWILSFGNALSTKELQQIYYTLIYSINEFHINPFVKNLKHIEGIPFTTHFIDKSSYGIGTNMFGVIMHPNFSELPKNIARDTYKIIQGGHFSGALAHTRIAPYTYTLTTMRGKPQRKYVWFISEMQSDPLQKTLKGNFDTFKSNYSGETPKKDKDMLLKDIEQQHSKSKSDYKSNLAAFEAAKNFRRYFRHWPENFLNSILTLAGENGVDEVWVPKGQDVRNDVDWSYIYDDAAKAFGGKLKNIGVDIQVDPSNTNATKEINEVYVIEVPKRDLKLQWRVGIDVSNTQLGDLVIAINDLPEAKIKSGEKFVVKNFQRTIKSFDPTRPIEEMVDAEFGPKMIELQEYEFPFASKAFPDRVDLPLNVFEENFELLEKGGGNPLLWSMVEEIRVTAIYWDNDGKWEELTDDEILTFRDNIHVAPEFYVVASSEIIWSHDLEGKVINYKGTKIYVPKDEDDSFNLDWKLSSKLSHHFNYVKDVLEKTPKYAYDTFFNTYNVPSIKMRNSDFINDVNQIVSKLGYDMNDIMGEKEVPVKEPPKKVPERETPNKPPIPQRRINPFKKPDHIQPGKEPQPKAEGLSLNWNFPSYKDAREIIKLLIVPEQWTIRYFAGFKNDSIILYPNYELRAELQPLDLAKVKEDIMQQLHDLEVSDYTFNVDTDRPFAIRFYFPVNRQSLKTPWKTIIEELERVWSRHIRDTRRNVGSYVVELFTLPNSHITRDIVSKVEELSGLTPVVTAFGHPNGRIRGTRIYIKIPKVSSLKLDWNTHTQEDRREPIALNLDWAVIPEPLKPGDPVAHEGMPDEYLGILVAIDKAEELTGYDNTGALREGLTEGYIYPTSICGAIKLTDSTFDATHVVYLLSELVKYNSNNTKTSAMQYPPNARIKAHPELEQQINQGNTPYHSLPQIPGSTFVDKISSNRFKLILENLEKYSGRPITTMQDLARSMMDVLEKINEIESQHTSDLENLAVEMVEQYFGIDPGEVEFDAKLIRDIEIEDIQNLEPEPQETMGMDENDLEVSKRRFINGMIQGVGINSLNMFHLVGDKLNEIDPNLVNMYGLITALAELGYWVTPPSLSGLSLSQAIPGGKVKLDLSDDTPKVITVAMNFPFLVQELVKGVMEVMSSHGLPEDPELREKVLQTSDTLKDESWDIRFGSEIWKEMLSYLNIGDEWNGRAISILYYTLVQMDKITFSDFVNKLLKGDPSTVQTWNQMYQQASEQSSFNPTEPTLELTQDLDKEEDLRPQPEELSKQEMIDNYLDQLQIAMKEGDQNKVNEIKRKINELQSLSSLKLDWNFDVDENIVLRALQNEVIAEELDQYQEYTHVKKLSKNQINFIFQNLVNLDKYDYVLYFIARRRVMGSFFYDLVGVNSENNIKVLEPSFIEHPKILPQE